MKKNQIWLCFFLLVAGGQAWSQTTSIGAYGGVSIPQIKSSSDDEITKDYRSRSAGTFGIYADFGITKTFSVKTIISYAGQGGKRNGMQPIPASAIPPGIPLPPVTIFANFNNESVLNYLEIPILAKWEWGDKFRYYVNAGPYIGFLLNATQITGGSSQFFLDKAGTQPISIIPAQSFDRETDIKESLNSTNIGLTGGVGIKYLVAPQHELLLDVRGAYGLTYLQKNQETDGKSRTGALFITIGYGFRLPAKAAK